MREVLRAQLREGLQGDAKAGAASLAIVSILEEEAAAMRFRDLAAQHETNAGAAGLRGEERHE